MTTPDEKLENQDIDKGKDIAVVVDVPAGAEISDPPVIAQPEPSPETQALMRQVAEAKAEAAALRTAEARAREDANAARIGERDSHLAAVTNAIEATTQKLDQLESDLATAHAAGDYKTAAKLQREISRGETKLSELDNGRVALEQRSQAGERPQITEGRVTVAQPQQRQIATLEDAVEDLASRVTPASAAWLRANPSVMKEPMKLGASHDYATKVKGLAQDTPEYFAFMESEFGIGAKSPSPRLQPAPTRAATFDAPVSRDTPSLSTGQARQRVINLTDRQQDMAESLGMTNQEYAQFLSEEQPSAGRAH